MFKRMCQIEIQILANLILEIRRKKWKGHISQKRDREKRNTASEKEWAAPAAEKFLKREEPEEENVFPHKYAEARSAARR